MTMIRPATFADIPLLIELGAMLHRESPRYSGTPWVPAKVGALLEVLIDGGGVVFVAERGGEIVGGLAGGVAREWFNDELYGHDYSVFVRPDARAGAGHAWKLMLAFQAWCRAKGARYIAVGITTAIQLDGTTRMYERMGFKQSGNLFRMEL